MRKLFSLRWIMAHLVVLVALAALVNLGFWQLRRLEQRRSQNSYILARLNAPPLTLTGAESLDNPEELQYRRVVVTGTFDNEEGIVLRNRPLQGKPGVHLVVPLRLADSDRAVLVDRGWIPLESRERAARAVYDISGPVTIEGLAYTTQLPPDNYLAGAATDPTPGPGQSRLDAWFRVDIARIQEQLPYSLLPIFIKVEPGEGAAEEPPVPVTDIALDEGPHLGYAIQWFTFALILAVTYGLFIRQELKTQGGGQETAANGG